MSEENVELVRRGYAAWNRGDVDAIVEGMAPEVELQGHRQLPEPGPHVGREAARRWFEHLGEPWESVSVDPGAFAEVGDSVIVLVSFSGRGRGSGVEVRSGLDAHIWTIAEGSVVRLLWLQGDEAARRASLSPLEADVLRLRTVDRLPDSEIGDRLDISEAEVSSLADSAQAKLPSLTDMVAP